MTFSDLLQQQQSEGFPDLAGAEATATIPISERLVNDLLSQSLANNSRVREVRVTVEDGNRLTLHIKPGGPSFLPSIPVTLAIEDQPALPDRPTLALRLVIAAALAAMAGTFVPMVTSQLPPGVSMEGGDRILIDIRRMLAEQKAERWLDFITDLRVTTRAGAIVLDVRAKVGPK